MSKAPPIYPVILCGGSGTRLWPVSRKAKPKPFLPLVGERTLFQQTLARVKAGAGFADPIIVAGAEHVDLIEQEITGAYRLIVEPAARSTAPAIALAAAQLDPDAIMLVCPSDHFIADTEAFHTAVRHAAQLAHGGHLVALGITPTRPETGYGYIEQGAPLGEGFRVARFIEKPDAERAAAYFAQGNMLWNGGIFAFRAGQLLEELGQHRPEMARAVQAASAASTFAGSQIHPDPMLFGEITGESIDYAVMETTQHAATVPVEMGWSDIGTWSALHDASDQDDNGNATKGTVDLVDCQNVLAISDGPRISAVDVEDICIVVNGDEVLVTTRDGAQKIGKLPGANER